MITRPSLWPMKPAMMRSKVVLPQPDGPSRAMISPPLTSRLMSETAIVPLAKRCVIRSRTSDLASDTLAMGFLLN